MTTNQTIDGVPRKLIERALLDARRVRFATDKQVIELRALLDGPGSCAHEWTDDGAHLVVCTACGAQEDHDPGWRDMATAPTDGAMVRLLVEFDEHSTEDAEQAITIGANNLDNDEEDAWRFAGWCWSHDHFTEGKGTPVGWLPMLDEPVSKPAAQPQGELIELPPMLDTVQMDGYQSPYDAGWNAYGIKVRAMGPLYAEQLAPVAVVMPGRDSLRDIIAQAIGGDTYDCTRVWSAWGVGTMSEDDFVPVIDQEARLYEIADACLDEVTRLNSK